MKKPVFTVGEIAIIDKGTRMEHRVKLLFVYGEILSTVKRVEDDDSEGYDALLSRLTKIKD